ncbi:MAG: flagellar motor switch protein FliM [Nocardioidaceae bacterium]|nr:flagellar motor switch protein FliM [Nocardioidaceae bacterium]
MTASPLTPSGAAARPQRRRRGTGTVSPYDFRRPVTLSRENSRLLQITFEAFARQAASVVTTALRSVCHCDLVSMDQVSYSEYAESLGESAFMAVVSAEPLKQPAVLATPLAMTMTCIDTLLGGPGVGPYPERPLTDLESAVIAPLYERMVAELRPTMASLVDLDPRITAVEYSPQLAQVASASEMMVVARYALRMGETQHPLSLCLSLSNLMPFVQAAASADDMSDADRQARVVATGHLTSALQDVPVDVAVRYRTTMASPLELAGLGVGDVVRLKHPTQAPLDVVAADVVFAHATAGSQGRSLAALVVASAHQENP